MEMENGSKPRANQVKRPIALLRMLLIVIVLILFLYFLWRGGILALLAWLATVIVLIDTSVNVLFAMYAESGSRRLGFFYWLYSILLGAQGAQIVTPGGEIKPVRPPGPLANIFSRLGGPGMVVINNGAAVVFERSGKFTRAKGPGLVWTKRFERIAKVIDLRRQVRTKRIEKIMTRDGLSFDLERLDVQFDLAADFDPQQGEYDFSEQALLDLIYRGGILYYQSGEEVEWGTRVVATMEYNLRNVAAGRTMEEFARGYEGNAREQFMKEVEERARPALRQYGVRLYGIDMGRIIMPEEVQAFLTLPLKQLVDLGWAHTQRDAIIGIAEGLKQALAKLQTTMPADAGEAGPHLFLNLADTLSRILEESLRLAASYREPRLLPGGEEEKRSPEK
jgi:regulator of protease activity HflC (stomatin/prohibitin superfamily)